MQTHRPNTRINPFVTTLFSLLLSSQILRRHRSRGLRGPRRNPGARELGGKSLDDVVIDHLYWGYSAQKAGMQKGDRILEVDGKKVANHKELIEAVIHRLAGETIAFTIERGGKQSQIKVTLGTETIVIGPLGPAWKRASGPARLRQSRASQTPMPPPMWHCRALLSSMHSTAGPSATRGCASARPTAERRGIGWTSAPRPCSARSSSPRTALDGSVATASRILPRRSAGTSCSVRRCSRQSSFARSTAEQPGTPPGSPPTFRCTRWRVLPRRFCWAASAAMPTPTGRPSRTTRN